MNTVDQKGCDHSFSIDKSNGPDNRHKALAETLDAS
jgi:hypothetical protein